MKLDPCLDILPLLLLPIETKGDRFIIYDNPKDIENKSGPFASFTFDDTRT